MVSKEATVRKSAVRSESFSKISGKRIDGGMAEVLVETLSLIGKLFEIYFVRLIGTPNQQFKKWHQLRLMSKLVVVHESLGS